MKVRMMTRNGMTVMKARNCDAYREGEVAIMMSRVDKREEGKKKKKNEHER